MDDQHVTAQEIRKKLWWILPFVVAMNFFFWWITTYFFVPEFKMLLEHAPTLRLAPAGWLSPLGGAFLAMGAVLAVLRAIPCHGPWLKRVAWLMNSIIFFAGGLLLIVFFGSSLVQNHYLPKLGYTQCELLEGGGPSVWSTDWVKNPDWCVKGKTREWVNEQAARQASTVQRAP